MKNHASETGEYSGKLAIWIVNSCRRMAKLPLFVCLAIAFACCGCSRQHQFAQRLAEADRVTATNASPDFSFGIEVTCVSPKKIAKAISSARSHDDVMALPYIRLEFFKGTNSLGTVFTLSECVMMTLERDKYFGRYIDSSGVLKAVENEFREKGRAELFRRLDRGEDCSNWPTFGSIEGTNYFPTPDAR